MKQTLAIATLALAMGLVHVQAEAKTMCNVNSGDPKQDMVFDRILYRGELTTPHYLLLKKGAAQIEEIQFLEFKNWIAVDGATLVALSRQQDGSVGISVSHVDISNKENSLPIDAMAIAQVPQQKYLNLIFPAKNLSILCMTDAQ